MKRAVLRHMNVVEDPSNDWHVVSNNITHLLFLDDKRKENWME
jgi:hypothetical protein